jgi:CBS domain-containing protein
MHRDPVTVPAGATLLEFVTGVVQLERHNAYPVVEDGRVVGLVPLTRVAEVPQSEWAARRVRDVMVGIDRVPVFAPEQELVTAASDLSEETLHRGLVLDEGRLVGVLSISDVSRAFDRRSRRD